jgi:hypothetical protein
MIPVSFPEANARYGPPPDLADSQCMTIHAYHGQVVGGSVDGSLIVVTAWKPSPDQIEAMKQGRPILLSFIGGLPPHFVSTDFHAATHPA